MNVTDLFNRQINSPQHITPSNLPTLSTRNSINNENEHRKSFTNINKENDRKSSNGQLMSNSIFYVPATNESKTTTPESDSSCDPNSVVKHSVKRGWVNKLFGTSPRPSISGEDFAGEINLESVQLEKIRFNLLLIYL